MLSNYFTPSDVAEHCTRTDCWVSYLGKVHDLTGVIRENEPRLVEVLVRNAGSDISHWFDTETRDIKLRPDPISGLPQPWRPDGMPLLHLWTPEPSLRPVDEVDTPWWRETHHCVGTLT
ncbi:hypothetical protein KIPB_009716, partial [Kipferlia bialata]|eukprot:g9716.t1